MNCNIKNMQIDIPNSKIEIGEAGGKCSMKELIILGIMGILVIILLPNGVVAKSLSGK
jgi:hypothetical protein